jgi:hypothetical protein
MLHEEVLTIPYGINDGAIRLAQVALPELLSRMDHRLRQRPAQWPVGRIWEDLSVFLSFFAARFSFSVLPGFFALSFRGDFSGTPDPR